jgi:hypothetical protein
VQIGAWPRERKGAIERRSQRQGTHMVEANPSRARGNGEKVQIHALILALRLSARDGHTLSLLRFGHAGLGSALVVGDRVLDAISSPGRR